MPSPMSPMLVWHSPSRFHACKFLGWYFTACTKGKHKQLEDQQLRTMHTATAAMLDRLSTVSVAVPCLQRLWLLTPCRQHHARRQNQDRVRLHGVLLDSRDTNNSCACFLYLHILLCTRHIMCLSRSSECSC